MPGRFETVGFLRRARRRCAAFAPSQPGDEPLVAAERDLVFSTVLIEFGNQLADFVRVRRLVEVDADGAKLRVLKRRGPREPPGCRFKCGQRAVDAASGLRAARNHPQAGRPTGALRDRGVDERERLIYRGFQGETSRRACGVRADVEPPQIDHAGNLAAFLSPRSPRGAGARRVRFAFDFRIRLAKAPIAALHERVDECGADAAAILQHDPGGWAPPRRGDGRRRLPDPLVEPFARACARLLDERVLADPLEFKALESGDEFVAGTIEVHVRAEDRGARARPGVQNGVRASTRRRRRKRAKAPHSNRQIKRFRIRVRTQRRRDRLQASVQQDRMDVVTPVARQFIAERDRAPGLAGAPPGLAHDMEPRAELDALLSKDFVKVVARRRIRAAGHDV